MFTVAKWIGAAPGELGFRSDEELTDEQMEARKQRAIDGEDPTRRGSLLLRGEFRLNSPAAAPRSRNVLITAEGGDHCMFASPDTFLYRRLGGVTVDRRSRIRPLLPR